MEPVGAEEINEIENIDINSDEENEEFITPQQVNTRKIQFKYLVPQFRVCLFILGA